MIAKLLAAGLLTIVSSGASPADFYANQSIGNDANNCTSPVTPCLTLAAIIARMPLVKPDGTLALNTVNLAAGGNWREVFDVSHGLRVALTGPYNSNGSCVNANAVRVDQVVAQDGAVVWNACLTTGSIGCRQYAIIDSREIVFDGSISVPYVAAEQCKINTAGQVWVNGPIVIFAMVMGGSTFLQAGDVWIKPGLSVQMFFEAIDGHLDLRAGTYSGSPISGLRTYCDHCDISYPVLGGALAVPGSGSAGANLSSNASR